MIALKKYNIFTLFALLIGACAGLLQGADESALSRRWSSVSNFGDKILKHPATPYMIAPVAAYAGITLGSKIADMGHDTARRLAWQDRYLSSLAVTAGTTIASGAASVLPSIIPLVLMNMQRRPLTSGQRLNSSLDYFNLVIPQAMFVGIPLVYNTFKQYPGISTEHLLRQFISSWLPGLIGAHAATYIEAKKDAHQLGWGISDEEIARRYWQNIENERSAIACQKEYERISKITHKQNKQINQFYNNIEDRWRLALQKRHQREIARQKNKGEKPEEEDTCTICLDDESDQDLKTTSCNHRFHEHCLTGWLAEHSTCPLCRTQIIR